MGFDGREERNSQAAQWVLMVVKGEIVRQHNGFATPSFMQVQTSAHLPTILKYSRPADRHVMSASTQNRAKSTFSTKQQQINSCTFSNM
ncbi:hypothetical protein PoB_004041000 [Plakobranchus ocellatus]|uniref:Uncharacterized protein n=1 Tax=Plakobranchus ocellatus TaxID=259542 RepID=A0AAV4B4A1_9GAST|nr:hypothetical protein PoB_004041000 [Plakobranchus ocellatus]